MQQARRNSLLQPLFPLEAHARAPWGHRGPQEEAPLSGHRIRQSHCSAELSRRRIIRSNGSSMIREQQGETADGAVVAGAAAAAAPPQEAHKQKCGSTKRRMTPSEAYVSAISCASESVA